MEKTHKDIGWGLIFSFTLFAALFAGMSVYFINYLSHKDNAQTTEYIREIKFSNIAKSTF